MAYITPWENNSKTYRELKKIVSSELPKHHLTFGGDGCGHGSHTYEKWMPPVSPAPDSCHVMPVVMVERKRGWKFSSSATPSLSHPVGKKKQTPAVDLNKGHLINYLKSMQQEERQVQRRQGRCPARLLLFPPFGWAPFSGPSHISGLLLAA